MEPLPPVFAHHKPGPRAAALLKIMRENYAALSRAIEELPGGPSREKSLALTELENSAMWLGKHIVKCDPQSVPE